MKNLFVNRLIIVFICKIIIMGLIAPNFLFAGDQPVVNYKLIAMMPETGNLAFIGKPTVCALNLAAEHMQSELDKSKINLEILFADTQGNPREAVTQYSRSVEMGNANGIITSLSGVIGAINPMASNKDILFIGLTPDPRFLDTNQR